MKLPSHKKLDKKVNNKFIYRIIAVDSSYNRSIPSINTLAQMPDVTAPVKPVIKQIIEKNGHILLIWLSNVELDLMGYNLYKRIKNDTLAEYKIINYSIIPRTITSYTDRSAKEGIIYEYILKAADFENNISSASSVFIGGLKQNKGEAKLVLTEKKISKKKQLTLVWNNENKNYKIKGYVVFVGDNKNQLKPTSDMLEETIYKQKLENINKTYYYQVRAFALSGEVIKTDIFTITTTKAAVN